MSGDSGGDPVRVGVIGCGYWGPQLIRNFHDTLDAELVGVAEKAEDRLNYVRSRYPRIGAYADHRELLDSDVEAIVVATPIHTHHALALEALRAGKHVLVEKPLAARVDEALELIEEAESRGLTLMVGHTFVYNPAVRELGRIVQSGELGRVYYVDAARLNLGLFQRNVNVIWDLAPHDVSILLYVLDEVPVAVAADGHCFVQRGVEDVAFIRLEFASGISARIHLSWLDPTKVRRMTVVGDRRMVVYNDVSLGEKIRIFDKGVNVPLTDNFGEFQLSYRQGSITIPNIDWQEPLRLECEQFLRSIRTGDAPPTGARQGLLVVAIIEAANRSICNNSSLIDLDLPSFAASSVASGDMTKFASDGQSARTLIAP